MPQMIQRQSANFYSHAREGRDDDFTTFDNERFDFYSHAREGRDIYEILTHLL